MGAHDLDPLPSIAQSIRIDTMMNDKIKSQQNSTLIFMNIFKNCTQTHYALQYSRRRHKMKGRQLFHFDCVIFGAIYLMPGKIMFLILKIELIQRSHTPKRKSIAERESQSHFCERREKWKFSLAIFKRNNQTHIISFYVCGDNGCSTKYTLYALWQD